MAAIAANDTGDIVLPATRRFKKIPIYVVEEHNDALQFIYSAIGGKKLPLEGTTLVHLDAHPDMLIDRKMTGEQARSGRNLLPLLQIENWIVPAVSAGHFSRVVWLKPPWAKQMKNGTRSFHVGDHPTTGLLRVDSVEPYFLSDALYSKDLVNKRKLKLTVAELSDCSFSPKVTVPELVQNINVNQPYVLDIDLDFFSTGNPFLSLYEGIKLYDLLEPIFGFKLPAEDDGSVEKVVAQRDQQLDELEKLFQHLEDHGDLDSYSGEKSELFDQVTTLAEAIKSEASRLGEEPDWWAVYAGGCTRDQGGLPFHISSEEEIKNMISGALEPLLIELPAPVLITVARSTDDGYCPSNQVDLIQTLVLQSLKKIYDTDDPQLNYLTVNTC